MGGFTHWVGRIFHDVTTDVVKVVTGTVNTVTTLYHILTNLGHNVGKAWHGFHRAMVTLGHDLGALGHATYLRLKHVYDVLVPAAVRHAITSAAHYAARIVGEVRHWAAGEIKAARALAVRLSHDLAQWAHDAVTDLRKGINALSSKVSAIEHSVGQLLRDPANLAKWAFGAFIREAVPWLEQNGEVFGRMLFRKAGRTIIDNAHAIESVLADII